MQNSHRLRYAARFEFQFMTHESPLRDLARKLRVVATEHPAYSQVVELMQLVDEHLSMRARIEETNINRDVACREIIELPRFISS
jgi:hypothetical protein